MPDKIKCAVCGMLYLNMAKACPNCGEPNIVCPICGSRNVSQTETHRKGRCGVIWFGIKDVASAGPDHRCDDCRHEF